MTFSIPDIFGLKIRSDFKYSHDGNNYREFLKFYPVYHSWTTLHTLKFSSNVSQSERPGKKINTTLTC